ncbi:MAG: hypothetical protein ACOY6K_22270 [Pseudomonadota bacterium]
MAVHKGFLAIPTALFLAATSASAYDPPVSAERAMRQVDEVLKAHAEANPDFEAAVREIRDAEELINAALQTADAAELRTQGGRLFQIEARLLKGTEPGDPRSACWRAAGDLSAAVSAIMRDETPARTLLAVNRLDKSYRENLASCERAIRANQRRARR